MQHQSYQTNDMDLNTKKKLNQWPSIHTPTNPQHMEALGMNTSLHKWDNYKYATNVSPQFLIKFGSGFQMVKQDQVECSLQQSTFFII